LLAVYARDFAEAYRYISLEDRQIKDQKLYVQQKGAFTGFSLEATKKLAEFVEIHYDQRRLAPDRIQAVARVKAPDPGKLAALLLDWNTYALNTLPPTERKKIIVALERAHRDGALPMTDREEQLQLVKEGDQWRIFLNWAAGIKIPLSVQLPKGSDLDVSLSMSEVVVQPGDVFAVSLKIKNRSTRTIIAAIDHIIEPSSLADALDLAECGFLLPVPIEPGEHVLSGRYVVRWTIPEGVRGLSLTYEFKPTR
jgi:hypothetical protein